MKESILLTGGRGFIGSHMLVHLCASNPEKTIVCADAETYAARRPLYHRPPKNLVSEKVDLRDHLAVHRLMQKYTPEVCVHMAAESHVCRSITGPKDFITTNVMGTFNLLEEFRACGGTRFVHISTDEVFGQIREGYFSEDSPVLPRNPYAASKASSDLLVRSYVETYGLDAVTVRMANNFGPNQHPEKLIPRTIRSILRREPVTVHGTGKNVREWLWVWDAVNSIAYAVENGKAGRVYCIAGEREMTNLETIDLIFECLREILPADSLSLELTHTDDRPTDDCRYAMKGKNLHEIKWKRHAQKFEDKFYETVKWYVHAIMRSRGRASHGRGA